MPSHWVTEILAGSVLESLQVQTVDRLLGMPRMPVASWELRTVTPHKGAWQTNHEGPHSMRKDRILHRQGANRRGGLRYLRLSLKGCLAFASPGNM